MEESLISRKDQRFLALAYCESAKVLEGQHRLGAVLIKGGRVIAKGYNSYVNCRHAEIACLSKTWKSERDGAVLYVVRRRRDQKFGMSKPCPNCEAFIRDSGIKKVFYTTNEGTVICERY